MIQLAIFSLFCLLNPVVLVFGPVPTERSSPPTVDVTQPLHFLSSTDEDVILPPWQYEVEAADAWLKLIPTDGHRNEAVLVQATSGNHQEAVDSPRVIFQHTKENPDLHYLLMLLPDGTGLGAIGFSSGARP